MVSIEYLAGSEGPLAFVFGVYLSLYLYFLKQKNLKMDRVRQAAGTHMKVQEKIEAPIEHIEDTARERDRAISIMARDANVLGDILILELVAAAAGMIGIPIMDQLGLWVEGLIDSIPFMAILIAGIGIEMRAFRRLNGLVF